MKSIFRIPVFIIAALLISTIALAVPTAVVVEPDASEIVYDSTPELMTEGTEEDPFVISSAEQFNFYAELINSGDSAYNDKYYKLSGNIDFEGKEIVPFGKLVTDGDESGDDGSLSFKGTLDGNGYAMQNVGMSGAYYSGVIGCMTQGTVKNLSVSYVSDDLSIDGAKFKFGGIAGFVKPLSGETVTISGCETGGNLVFSSSTPVYAGGVVAHALTKKGNLEVTDCVSRISFDIESTYSGYVGGMVAYAIANSSKNYIFKNCISYGDLSYVTSYIEATVGGFAGHLNKDGSGWTDFLSENAALLEDINQFEACVAMGNVFGQSRKSVRVGEFVADFAGEGEINITSCYNLSGQTAEGAVATSISVYSDATEAASAQELASEEFYEALGYDFTDKWYVGSEGLQPRTTAKQYGSASVLESTSLRLVDDGRAGLRFTAKIDEEKRAYCYEYGFVVATKATVGEGELSFDTYPCIVGVGYNTYDDVDIIYSRTDEEVTFTGVIYNIGEENYSTVILACPYISYNCEGEVITLFGNVAEGSVSETASSFYNDKDFFDSLATEQQEMLKAMLPEA